MFNRSQRVRKTCVQCGELFVVYRSHADQVCCSPACGLEYRRRNQARLACELCGTAFTARSSRSDARYCSSACQYEAQRRQVTKTCAYCDASYTVALSEAHRSRFCSRACRNRFSTGTALTCDHCGKRYWVEAHRAHTSRFCTYECRYLWEGETAIERDVRLALITLNVTFEAQHRLGRYRLDFYLPDYRIALEVDGEYWHDAKRDLLRDVWVLGRGITTIRITSSELRTARNAVALVARKLRAYLGDA